MLGDASSGAYAARPFPQTDTFWRLVAVALRGSSVKLDGLVPQYLSAAEASQLEGFGITTVAGLFTDPPGSMIPEIVSTVRARLVAAVEATLSNP